MKPTAGDPWETWQRRLTEAAVRVVAIAGSVHQLFLAEKPDMALLVFLVGLLGLPTVVSLDRRRERQDDGSV